MFSFDVWKVYLEHLKNFKKVNEIFNDLKSDALKDKHRTQLLLKLNIKIKAEDLLLNDLWVADLLSKKKIIDEVLTQARGEKILEDQYHAIKDRWTNMEVELAQYKTKCKLIRGWDELFALVDDDTNNINSMKMSPYYKVFESEIKPLIQDLEKIRIMFDSWIDVQRKYVYLEGIFFGSADIAQMLSNEFNKFKNIDNEFTKLMTEVKKNPKVKTILEIPNVERQLNNFVMQLEHL